MKKQFCCCKQGRFFVLNLYFVHIFLCFFVYLTSIYKYYAYKVMRERGKSLNISLRRRRFPRKKVIATAKRCECVYK